MPGDEPKGFERGWLAADEVAATWWSEIDVRDGGLTGSVAADRIGLRSLANEFQLNTVCAPRTILDASHPKVRRGRRAAAESVRSRGAFRHSLPTTGFGGVAPDAGCGRASGLNIAVAYRRDHANYPNDGEHWRDG